LTFENVSSSKNDMRIAVSVAWVAVCTWFWFRVAIIYT